MENPFKFGTIVEDEFFTDRENEVTYIRHFVESPNHLVLISPRRFGKSSVVAKAVKLTGRKHITINLQNVTSVKDFAEKILREFFKVHPLERLKHLFTSFRVIPTISTNPLSGEMNVSFQPVGDGTVQLEDALALIEKAHSGKSRLIVVLDEFQEIKEISPNLDRQLRAVMQAQKHINYILLGSQESMMTEIFESKKSPFYHFGELMRLGRIPRDDFRSYLSVRLSNIFNGEEGEIADRILDYTGCHPYYTQQLASNVWQMEVLKQETQDVVRSAIEQIVKTHGLDYERLWMRFNRTNRWILQRLARGESLQTGEHRTSTIYSALKKLQKDGYVIYSDQYELEDPFFKQWIADGE